MRSLFQLLSVLSLFFLLPCLASSQSLSDQLPQRLESALEKKIPKDLKRVLKKGTLGAVSAEGIEKRSALSHFKPWQLISVKIDDPNPVFSKRFPSFKTKFVYNPQTDELFEVTKDWILNYRKKKPIKLDQLTPLPLRDYLMELERLAPLAGHREVVNFKVFQISKRTYEISYSFKNELGQDDSSSLLLTLTDHGAIEGARRRGSLPEADPDIWFLD